MQGRCRVTAFKKSSWKHEDLIKAVTEKFPSRLRGLRGFTDSGNVPALN
jgi:hypothetical protein